MKRRSFSTSLGGTALLGLAGCVGGWNDNTRDTLSGSIRPEDDSELVLEPLECDRDDGDRHPTKYDEAEVVWGDATNFSFRIDELSFIYGDTAHLSLANMTSETQLVGNSRKFQFEVYTEMGWQDVRVWTADYPLAYTDEGIQIEPDGGYEWDIELTESGIVDASIKNDYFEVCPELESGRYRFVYWGVTDAVAVAFDLET